MKTIRIGICALTAFAVAAFGGVEWWAAGVLEIGAAGLFLLWGMLAVSERQAEITWNWIYIPMFGVAAIIAAQTILGRSAYPYATKIESLKYGAYFLLCLLGAESFRTAKERRTFAWFLITLSFAFALFGIAQYLAFNGKLYWLIPLPEGAEPFGPYVNRDHFAGFVELTAPLGLAMLFGKPIQRDKTPLLALFTAVPIVALLLAGSRGGITGFAVAYLLVWTLARSRPAGEKGLLGLLALGILVGGLAFWLGAGKTFGRFARISSGEVTRSQRIAMDRDTWKIFVGHKWMGTGLGTLETVYPKYATFFDGRVVDHSHNDYLEFMAELGAIGGMLGAGFIALLFWRGIANLRAAGHAADRAFIAGALGACAAMLVHSFVDFNLHIPANALLFLLLATLASAENPDSGECQG